MAESFPADTLRELVARGRLPPGSVPAPLAGGNADRRPEFRRRAWKAAAPDGRPLRLVVGRELAALARRQEAFASLAPGLVAAPSFVESIGDIEILAEPLIDGDSLESHFARAPSSEDELGSAFAKAMRALASTTTTSSEAERRAEWDGFASAVPAVPGWSDVERELLASSVLPALYPHLASSPPVTRWTNGDLTAANLLLERDGTPRLVDFEFAQRTHFFAEDGVRFLALSRVGRTRPELFRPHLPPAGPAWHLYFWLRQCLLEARQNTPAYLARVRPHRLGVIRRLAATVLGAELEGWSAPPLPLSFNVEVVRWFQDGNAGFEIAGWCHVPSVASRRVIAMQGDTLFAESRELDRPDVAAHLGADARRSGFELRFPLREARRDLIVAAVTEDGALLPFTRVQPAVAPGRGPAMSDYPGWAAREDPDPPPPSHPASAGARFSLLVPVFNPPLEFLRACLDSALRQHYPHWELHAVDDASTAPGVRACLEDFARRDPRIRLHFRASNGGIARATNDALAAAAGEFIALLDHDDELRPHALAAMAQHIAASPGVDVLYSDEEKISAAGRSLTPFLKPAFSPEFLLGVMYPGHLLCARTAVARAAGGFDPAFDGVQDFEFFLRLTEHTRHFAHVPRILYRWRQSPSSSALHGNIKGDMDARQAAAVSAHLQRRGDPRSVIALGGHRVRLAAAGKNSAATVPLPAGTSPVDTLRACRATEEIIVLATAGLAPLPAADLRELAALAARPDSGFVAPVLLSPDGRIHESGWTIGQGVAAPVARGFDAAGDGYNGSLLCSREVAAVSPACAAIRAAVLAEALAALPAGADWFALLEEFRRRGLHHRVCAAARVQVDANWRDFPPTSPGRDPDPYFNPHFDPTRADYSLATPPAHLAKADPWRWHLDVIPEAVAEDGAVEVRGWCFRRDRQPVTVHLRAGGVHWSALSQLPRPDVAASFAGVTDGACGFVLRVRVPAGVHVLEVVAVAAGGEQTALHSSPLRIPALSGLRRWLAPEPARLLKFQLLAGPTQPATALRPDKIPRVARVAAPRFSIVTPSYNQAQFLAQTMTGVLRQDAAVDYVVQDGGSTDGSVDVIRRLAAEFPGADPTASRLLNWESARDQGQASAIIQGFAKTSGGPDDLMAWINSDDFYLPGTLGYVADWFARHPDVDVVYGHRLVVDDQSREIGRWFLPPHSDEVLRLNDFIPQETLFWRRRIWDRAGGLDPAFQFALDWDLLLRFAQAGAKIVRLPYFLACFRVHAAQKTSSQIHSVGQREIDLLRTRAQGRELPPDQLEHDPRLLRYLRQSARLEWLWSFGIRAR